MHVVQFPGNIEGDFEIDGATRFNFTARSSDNQKLQALTVRVPRFGSDLLCEPRIPILFFGGNAQGMSGAANDAELLLYQLIRLNRRLRFQVFTFAYRGYAPNAGWTSQAGTRSDAKDLLEYALSSTSLCGVRSRALIAGWSMGAAVANQLAAAQPHLVAGLLVVAPWQSLRRETLTIALPFSYALLPFLWMVDAWDSEKAIASLPRDIPVSVVSPGDDHLISPAQHRAIFDASAAERKWWLRVPGAAHNMLKYMVSYASDGIDQWAAEAIARVHFDGGRVHRFKALPEQWAELATAFTDANTASLHI